MRGSTENPNVTAFMRTLWDRWKAVGRRLGDLQARLLLFLFYFLVLAPFAILLRIFSDPLGLKRTTPLGWRLKVPSRGDLFVVSRRQF